MHYILKTRQPLVIQELVNRIGFKNTRQQSALVSPSPSVIRGKIKGSRSESCCCWISKKKILFISTDFLSH